VPLVGKEGLPLGTLCVIDDKTRVLSSAQQRSLTALSDQVMNLLNLRKNEKLLEEALLNLEEKNQELERFAFIAAHDLKSPLIGVSGIAQMFSEVYGSLVDDEGKHMLQLLISSTDKLGSLIDGLLDYSKSEKLLTGEKSNIDPDSLKNEIAGLFTFSNNLQLGLKSSVTKLYANKTVLDQILINLVTNAIKYNDKNLIEIELGISENDTHYNFYVQDNGPGIDPKYHDRIFNIFETVTAKDKFGQAGNGIGLATVKKIVLKSGGSIKVESEPGKGARFMFTLEK
ncbi:MAG TPA: ATP-binding protein, partial [Gillisia sp.]|nr:ATP-binding protein [Gillisia sp.]